EAENRTEAPPSPVTFGQTSLEGELQLFQGFLGTNGLLAPARSIRTRGLVTKIDKPAHRRFRGRDTPSRVLHQSEGDLHQPMVPAIREHLGTGQECPAVSALAPIRGDLRILHSVRSLHRAGTDTFLHFQESLLRPISRIVLSDRLL